jgi:hypothetical protein
MRLDFVAYGSPSAQSGLARRLTNVFENIAALFVVGLFAAGLWLTGHAIWGMAADARGRRLEFERFSANKPPARP